MTKDSPRPQYKVRESEFDGRPELCVETSVDQGVEESADQGEPLYEGHHLGVGAAAPRTKWLKTKQSFNETPDLNLNSSGTV